MSTSEAAWGERLQAMVAAGDTAAAITACEAALAETPSDARAHRFLALIQAAEGKRGSALAAAASACWLAPDDPKTWSDLGRVYAMAGEHGNADECFTEAIEIDVRFADGWHNLGLSMQRLGRAEAAFEALRNALLLTPDAAETYLALGNLLVSAGQFDDALEAFERAAARDPSLARARSRLARHLSRHGKVKRAESLFRQSIGLDPDHVEGWFGLASTLEDLGEAESAEAAYLNVLTRRPQHPAALGAYLALTRSDAAPWTERAREILADGTLSFEARALTGYGLAKYHDRRGEFREAAEAGTKANAARRDHAGPLDRAELTARIDGIIATYTADFFAGRKRLGVGTGQPVFIVGLPRSGTTLTEQILSAHPQLHGAGELPDLARLATRVAAGHDGDLPWQAALRLTEPLSRALAGDYLRALRDGVPKGRLRISDKSPLNFLQLAFAALLFPGARVVHCSRAARDNAFAIWMENFSPEQHYATDFDDIAFFHTEYRRLMAHWRAVLPLPILEMRYEESVADLESQARRLVDFVGAPWSERCLEFHNDRRAVQTPSRWQVRQPIYTRSVDRWKPYAPHLPTLDAAFNAYMP